MFVITHIRLCPFKCASKAEKMGVVFYNKSKTKNARRTLQFFSETQEVIHPEGWEILLSLVILKMYTCKGFDASRVKLEPF